MSRFRRRKARSALSQQAFHRILPNLATIAALCVGMSSVRFALNAQWEMAVTMIIMAGILDGMDGRLARMLGCTSRFGANLDCLSDFMSFGAAPAIILYLFSLKALGGLGWAVVLVFAVCMSLRLARFNVQIDTPSPLMALRGAFSTGVPAPAAAVLALSPLMMWLDHHCVLAKEPIFVGCVALVVAGLMISRLPTYLFKTLTVSQGTMILLLLLGAMVTAGLMSAPWRTLLGLCGVYICLIPYSALRFYQQKKALLEKVYPSDFKKPGRQANPED